MVCVPIPRTFVGGVLIPRYHLNNSASENDHFAHSSRSSMVEAIDKPPSLFFDVCMAFVTHSSPCRLKARFPHEPVRWCRLQGTHRTYADHRRWRSLGSIFPGWSACTRSDTCFTLEWRWRRFGGCMAEEKLNAFRLGRNDEQFSSLLTGFEDGFWDACFSKLSQRAIAGFPVCTYMQHDLGNEHTKAAACIRHLPEVRARKYVGL